MLARPGPPVAIDARAAVRPELGGVERWARELVARLPELAPGRYCVVAPRPRLAHRAGHAWEQLVLPARAARAGAGKLLCPANLAPLAARNVVLIVHDAAPLRHPRSYTPAYAAAQRVLLPRLLRRADHVITVSAFSRGELLELFDLEPARVSVVFGGVDLAPAPGAEARARAALGLRRPYVLTVAARTARKNLAALEEAAAALARQGVDLVAAGGHRPQFASEELRGIRQLGHVPDPLLAGLYAGAAAFVLPSVYEGFGLPVLEAMACGTPVVAAARAALPETAGDAALMVEPEPEPLRDALLAILADAELARALRARGRERAAAFSWARTAAEVDAVLSARLAGRRPAPARS